MNKSERDELDELMRDEFLIGCFQSFLFFLIMAAILLLFSCCTTTRYVTVIETRTDTLVIHKTKYDSIHVQDSTFLHEAKHGDTLLVEKVKYIREVKWHTVRDSFYIATHDTIPEPYPVEVKVEKKLTWWQKARMDVGTIAIVLLLVFIGWEALKLWRKLHPV